MLFNTIDKELYSEWLEKVNMYDKSSLIYHALKDNRYHIYFSFLPKETKILYEGLPKDDILPYISLKIGADRIVKNDEVSEAFACYLYEIESKLSDDELKNIYGNIYTELETYLSIDSKSLKIKQNLNRDYKNLFDAVYNIPEFKIVSNIDYTKSILDISFKIFYNNEFVDITDLDNLFLVMTKGGLLQDKIPLNQYSIHYNERKKLLQLKFIIKKLNVNVKSGHILLKNDEIIPFFREYNSDELFKIQLNDFDIQHGDVSIDSYGDFIFTPEINSSLFIDEFFIYSATENTLNVYLFDSMMKFNLFKFKHDYPNFIFNLFTDEIISEIDNGEINVSSDYSLTHHKTTLNIRYYVTYKNDALYFSTEFFKNNFSVLKDDFVLSLLGKKKFELFKWYLDSYSLPMNGVIKSSKSILAFLHQDLTQLKKYCDIYLSENLSHRKVSSIKGISVAVDSNIDWLNIKLTSSEYTQEEIEKILSAYKDKKSYVLLKDTFIDFTSDDNKQFVEFVKDLNIEKSQTEHVPFYKILKIKAYESSDIQIELDEKLNGLFNELANFKESEINLNPQVLNKLRPYQIDGVKWLNILSKYNLSGILADDMGLGKTLEVIAFLSLNTIKKPVLVVAPKSLIYNWENEYKKWMDNIKPVVLDADKIKRSEILRKIDFNSQTCIITSYETLRNEMETLSQYEFSYIVLDEAQNIANTDAKKTIAVKNIHADHKIALTGTPIQNSLIDLWSIFDFLMPGYLPSFKDFITDYGKLTIESEYKKKVLTKKIAPFILKRNKNDVLKDLPPKEERVFTVVMNDKQKQLYEAYLQRVKNDLRSGMDKVTILSEITRLREICVDPNMFVDGFDETSEKLTFAMNIIKSTILNGHKILVFSTFVQTLLHLKNLLSDEKIVSYLITGDTKAKDRVILTDQFNNQDVAKVMLVSLKAGGVGLNLTGADMVIHLDPWWNVAAENQASDRAHRIGQTRKVTIFKLVCKDSIEERIIELQNMKKSLTDIIKDDESNLTSLSIRDIDYLLE